jgi:hypothetical protein
VCTLVKLVKEGTAAAVHPLVLAIASEASRGGSGHIDAFPLAIHPLRHVAEILELLLLLSLTLLLLNPLVTYRYIHTHNRTH